MILNFDTIEEQIIPNFKGGEKEFRTHMYTDEACKIMRASLEPGAAIGVHTHEADCEMIFMLKGTGVVLYDGGTETLFFNTNNIMERTERNGRDMFSMRPGFLVTKEHGVVQKAVQKVTFANSIAEPITIDEDHIYIHID